MINAALFAKLKEWHTELGKWGYKNYKKHGENPVSSEKTPRL